jgi:GNAT superfamily N-acetyltransferase
MKTAIRMFKKKDVDKILPLIKEYRQQHHKIVVDDSIIECTREVLNSMVEHKDSFVYVCEVDNNVVGYMVIHYCPFPLLGANEVYVTDLVVNPEFRNKGIGQAFMEKAKEVGRAMKCKRLMLNNNKTSEAYLRSFYRKCSFEERNGFANFVFNL